MKPIKVLCMLTFMAAGCQAIFHRTSSLDFSVCPPPCWQNITPGLTSEEKMLEILPTIKYIEPDSIYFTDLPWQGFDSQVGCAIDDGRDIISFQALFLDDRVAWMAFDGETGMTIDQAIQIFGEPEFITIVHFNDLFVYISNPDKGIAFGYSTIGKPDTWLLEIQPEMEIGGVILFDPNAYQQILEAGLMSSGVYDAEQTLQVTYPWKGFGDINTLYPGAFP
ncbi:MAG: hypothetical protein HY781_13470 [Chloroflexi bacterium]|nr:hypothetical protein [Chloroflexota bacterium]